MVLTCAVNQPVNIYKYIQISISFRKIICWKFLEKNSNDFLDRQENHYYQDFNKLLSLIIFSARWAYSISVMSDLPFQILSRCYVNFLRECRYISASSPYLGRESRSVVGPPLVCIYGVIHTRGWKVVMPGEARWPRIVHTYIRCRCTGRLLVPQHRPSSGADVARAISPDPPWVWYHLPTEIMVSAVDVTPRGLRVLVYYICPRNPRARSAHTCAHPPCVREESTRYCPPATGADCATLLLTNGIVFERYGRAISEGKNNAVTFFHKDSVSREIFLRRSKVFGYPIACVVLMHLETCHQP